MKLVSSVATMKFRSENDSFLILRICATTSVMSICIKGTVPIDEALIIVKSYLVEITKVCYDKDIPEARVIAEELNKSNTDLEQYIDNGGNYIDLYN